MTALRYTRVYQFALKLKSNNLLEMDDKTLEAATSIDITNFEKLSPSSIYQLAAPSTPETAVKEVAERQASGEVLKHDEVKNIIDEHKASLADEFADPTQPPPPTQPTPQKSGYSQEAFLAAQAAYAQAQARKASRGSRQSSPKDTGIKSDTDINAISQNATASASASLRKAEEVGRDIENHCGRFQPTQIKGLAEACQLVANAWLDLAKALLKSTRQVH